MKVDGTPYEISEHSVPSLRGWFVVLDGVAVAGPFRSKGEALSVAFSRDRQRELAAAGVAS